MEKQQVTEFVAGDVVEMPGGEPMTVLEICTKSSLLVLGGDEGDVHCVWWANDDFQYGYLKRQILQLKRHRIPQSLVVNDIVVLASGSNELIVSDVYEDNSEKLVCLVDPKTKKQFYDFSAHLFDKVDKIK